MAERDYKAELEAAMATIERLQHKLDAALQKHIDDATAHQAAADKRCADLQAECDAKIAAARRDYLTQKQALEMGELARRHQAELAGQ
jgi:hypothetical protein